MAGSEQLNQMPGQMTRAGINLIPEAPVEKMVDLAIAAEELGFGRCWVYDEGLATRDVYVTMAAILLATDHLEVGPRITNAYTRHPGQTAAAIATLDEMSGGRAFLGMGAGGSLTLDPLAITRDRPLETVKQAIAVCRGLFSGETIDLDGPGFSLRSANLAYSRPDIQIWLAGRGPRMLDLGGAVADGVLLDFIHKPSLGEYVERVRTGAERTGNQPGICYSTMIVTDERSLEAVRPHMTYRLVDSPPDVREALDISDSDVAAIRSAMADGLEAAARLVPDEWVLPFVVSGTVEECSVELHNLMDSHGINEFKIPVYDIDHGRELLEVTARVLEQR